MQAEHNPAAVTSVLHGRERQAVASGLLRDSMVVREGLELAASPLRIKMLLTAIYKNSQTNGDINRERVQSRFLYTITTGERQLKDQGHVHLGSKLCKVQFPPIIRRDVNVAVRT
jgi:hypothetical protein